MLGLKTILCIAALVYCVSSKSIAKRNYESGYNAGSSYGGQQYEEKPVLISNYNPCTDNYGSGYDYAPQYHPADSSYGNNWFIECNWNIPYLFQCAEGTVWKQEILTCDWPESYYQQNYGQAPSYNNERVYKLSAQMNSNKMRSVGMNTQMPMPMQGQVTAQMRAAGMMAPGFMSNGRLMNSPMMNSPMMNMKSVDVTRPQEVPAPVPTETQVPEQQVTTPVMPTGVQKPQQAFGTKKSPTQQFAPQRPTQMFAPMFSSNGKFQAPNQMQMQKKFETPSQFGVQGQVNGEQEATTTTTTTVGTPLKVDKKAMQMMFAPNNMNMMNQQRRSQQQQ